MNWRALRGPDRPAWSRAGELSDSDLAEWVGAELAGEGLARTRDDEALVDVVRAAWTAGDATFQHRLGAVLVAEFVRRFAAVEYREGEASGADRVALHDLLDCFIALPIASSPLDLFERGTKVEWARPTTQGLRAPHPLRQAFAEAWLARGIVRGRALRQLLADPSLTDLAFGSLHDLSVAVEYLPHALRSWGDRTNSLRVHFRYLVERHGAGAVREALKAQRLDSSHRNAIDTALLALNVVPPVRSVAPFENSGLVANQEAS